MANVTRCFSLLMVAIMVLGLFIGCAAPTPEGDVLTIATDATWPPFEYVDEQSKAIVGFDVDLMRAIAAAEGLNVRIVNVSWDALLAGVAQGEYDAAISVITITPERQQQMLFSDPYYNAGQVIVVREGETAIQSPADLNGHLAGAQLGTTGAREIQNIAGAQLKTYDTIDLAFLDLLNGQIDAVVVDNPLAQGYVARYAGKLRIVGEPFTNEWYGIAIAPKHQALVERINRGLRKVQESGQFAALEQQWLKGTQP